VLIAGILGLFVGGCTVTSFLGRQLTNFTAYYNKFHNANAAFDEGVQSIEEREQSIDRTQYVSVFLTPTGQVDDSPFDKAIQKSADVLRDHPDSKWVDDALLLIGKSYYYQQNYVGGAQKFREVIALNGERTQEARFWLARALVATERYEAAAEVIRTGIERRGGGSWTARLYLVRGQLLAGQERWEAATQALNQGLQGEVPGDVAARAAFLLGQTLETLGRPAPARTAYREVRSYDPSYSLELAARLNDIELQGTHGDAARALDRLRDLETDEKNYDQRGEMAVVRARIYRAQGQHAQARQTLRAMLYDDEAPSGGARGRLHYDLARLYRDAFKDFSRAAAHFDTASTTLGSPSPERGEEDARRMPAAPTDAEAQADRYRNLAERARTVARLDSLLRLGRMSDQAFRQYVEERRRRRQAEREAQAEDEQSRSRSRRLGSRGEALAERRQGAAPAADTRQSDAGFLFHKDPARVQRGKRQFEQTWGDRPLVDNWRRRVAIRSTGGGAAEQEETASEPEAPRSPEPVARSRAEAPTGGAVGLDLSAIPRDSSSLAEMEAQRTVARYKLANSLFLAASRPDSAATWYRRILQESGDHPVAERALYALAEAYRAEGDSTAAQQAYRQLIDRYPETELAERARRRLDGAGQGASDNLQVRADSAYARVYDRWQGEQRQSGQRDTVLAGFLEVAVRYPNTKTAPQALLAAGIVYWEHAQRDSAKALRSVMRRSLRKLRPALGSDSTALSAMGATEADGRRGPVNGGADSSRASPPNSDAAHRDARRTSGARGDTSRAPRTRPADSLQAASRDSAAEQTLDRSGRDSRTRTETDTTASASTGRDSDVYAPLKALMTHLVERYPDARQVERARSILELIEKRRTQREGLLADTTATDTTGAAPSQERAGSRGADTTAVDTAAIGASQRGQTRRPSASRADRTRSAAPAQQREASGDRTVLPAPSRPRGTGEQEGQKINPETGGWTLLVQTFEQSQTASARVAEVGRRLGDHWPVEVLEEERDGGTRYRVVVGQFRSRQVAAEAQKRVGGRLGEQPQVWALSPLDERP
jgi:TolA-binding protein